MSDMNVEGEDFKSPVSEEEKRLGNEGNVIANDNNTDNAENHELNSNNNIAAEGNDSEEDENDDDLCFLTQCVPEEDDDDDDDDSYANVKNDINTTEQTPESLLVSKTKTTNNMQLNNNSYHEHDDEKRGEIIMKQKILNQAEEEEGLLVIGKEEECTNRTHVEDDLKDCTSIDALQDGTDNQRKDVKKQANNEAHFPSPSRPSSLLNTTASTDNQKSNENKVEEKDSALSHHDPLKLDSKKSQDSIEKNEMKEFSPLNHTNTLSVYNGDTQSLPSQFPPLVETLLKSTTLEIEKALLSSPSQGNGVLEVKDNASKITETTKWSSSHDCDEEAPEEKVTNATKSSLTPLALSTESISQQEFAQETQSQQFENKFHDNDHNNYYSLSNNNDDSYYNDITEPFHATTESDNLPDKNSQMLKVILTQAICRGWISRRRRQEVMLKSRKDSDGNGRNNSATENHTTITSMNENEEEEEEMEITFSPNNNDKNSIVTVIQRAFRSYRRMRKNTVSATLIQAHYRGWNTRNKQLSCLTAKKQINNDDVRKNIASATLIQAHYRGWNTRNKQLSCLTAKKQINNDDDNNNGDEVQNMETTTITTNNSHNEEVFKSNNHPLSADQCLDETETEVYNSEKEIQIMSDDVCNDTLSKTHINNNGGGGSGSLLSITPTAHTDDILLSYPRDYLQGGDKEKESKEHQQNWSSDIMIEQKKTNETDNDTGCTDNRSNIQEKGAQNKSTIILPSLSLTPITASQNLLEPQEIMTDMKKKEKQQGMQIMNKLNFNKIQRKNAHLSSTDDIIDSEEEDVKVGSVKEADDGDVLTGNYDDMLNGRGVRTKIKEQEIQGMLTKGSSCAILDTHKEESSSKMQCNDEKKKNLTKEDDKLIDLQNESFRSKTKTTTALRKNKKVENKTPNHGKWLDSKRTQKRRASSPQLCPPRISALKFTESEGDSGYIGGTTDENEYSIRAEEGESSASFNDTQTGDEIDLIGKATTLRRLVRGTDSSYKPKHSNRRLAETYVQKKIIDEEEEYSDDENELSQDNDAEVYESLMSQTTTNIKAKLRVFEGINVSKVTEHLVDINIMKQQIEELKNKNSFLTTENRRILKEKDILQVKFGKVNKKLHEKQLLCKEMEKQMTRMEPILKVAAEVGSLLPSTSNKKITISKGSKTKKNSKILSSKIVTPRRIIEESESEEEKEHNTEVENIGFQTPKKTLGSDVRIVSTTNKERKKERIVVKGKVTFNHLWNFLQGRGWKFLVGPEPFGMVYVPPNGNVRKGSSLGKDFYAANDLWERAIELGFIDSDSDCENSDTDEYNSIAVQNGCQSMALKKDEQKTTFSIKKAGHVPTSLVPTPKRKRLAIESSRKDFSERKARHIVSLPSKKVGKREDVVVVSDKKIDDHDNTVLCGSTKMLTQRSIVKCARLILEFMSKKSDTSLLGGLFAPLWKCIKDEQGDDVEGLGWNYVKSVRAGELGRDYWFAPPKSVGSSGIFGKDYFTTEEAVIAHVLKDLMEFDHGMTGFGKYDNKKFDTFMIKLSRAVQEHMPFNEISDDLSSCTGRHSRKRVISREITSQSSPKKKQKKEAKQRESDVTSKLYSQNTIEGAEILLEMTNTAAITETLQSNQDCLTQKRIATSKGISNLLKFRSNRIAEGQMSVDAVAEDFKANKKLKLTPLKSEKNAGKIACDDYHLTQSPSSTQGSSWAAFKRRTRTDDIDRPLDGLRFFASGIDNDMSKLIVNFGGQLLNNVGGEDLKVANNFRKLFFVSDPKFRRTHKYVLACSLGVPMLHFNWLVDLKKSFLEYKRGLKDGVEDAVEKPPSAFESHRYTSHRLPLGLSNETGLFVMQRARHAKKWLRPKCGANDSLVLDGLTIAVALEKLEIEKKWVDIISSAGATIANLSDNSNTTANELKKVDMILVDSICLPPFRMAVPTRISRVLNYVTRLNQECDDTGENNIPIIDLSWVTQCIIRRTRVSIDDNTKRYRVTVGSSSGSSSANPNKNLFAIKVKTSTGLVRYEVGDSIVFGKKNINIDDTKRSFYGRITSIHHDYIKKKNTVEVKVLELHNKYELMDGGKNVSSINLDESELQGHIVLLGGKDFTDVYDGWARDSGIVFLQKKV